MTFSWPDQFSTLTGTIFCSVDLAMAFADIRSVCISAGSTTHKRFSSQSPSIRAHINDSLRSGNFCWSQLSSWRALDAYIRRQGVCPHFASYSNLIICCPILQLIPWAIIKSAPMITSSTISRLFFLDTSDSLVDWLMNFLLLSRCCFKLFSNFLQNGCFCSLVQLLTFSSRSFLYISQKFLVFGFRIFK